MEKPSHCRYHGVSHIKPKGDKLQARTSRGTYWLYSCMLPLIDFPTRSQNPLHFPYDVSIS